MTFFGRPAALIVALLALAGMLFVASPRPAAAATVSVPVGDFWFCNSSFDGSVCETTIQAGDTVVWDFGGANQHTSTACGASCSSATSSPLWDSGLLSSGAFQFTFTQAGTYLYHCAIHPDLMQGRIVVQAAATPTATPTLVTSGTFPLATLPPTATPGGSLPTSGQGPQPAAIDWWLLGALAAAGAAITSLGALAYARRPR